MTSAAARKLPITAIVLTFNEALHIKRCLSRILPLVERVVVVDSFSTDDTIFIARSMGADVYQRAWKNYADQLQWGMDNTGIATPWTLRLDADEYIEDAAQERLRKRLPNLSEDITALELRLKVVFRGQWIRHGRMNGTVLLRLWRTGIGHIEQRWMDEHIVLSHGGTERIDAGCLVDHNLNDITWWTAKHNGYATRHMVDFVNREYGLFREDERIRRTSTAARRTRFLKNFAYGNAPIYLRSCLFFLYRYFVRLGFLDGKNGFALHFLHGFWLMVLIDAKIDEARSFIAHHGIDAFREHLKTRYGIELG